MSSATVTDARDGASAERPAEAAASLYELHGQRIREYCYGQLRDRQEAEDALQATFLYAFTLLRRGTKPKRPLPWLYTIAHNVCRTRRRALKRRRQLESGVDLETLHDSVGRNDPPREDVAELASSLTALPSAQREALLLREWQGLSYAEIATYLGLTESAVEAVLFRARRSLARTLRPAGERVASVVNAVVLLRMLRRFAPFGSSAKASGAMFLAGAAAATTLMPLADAPTRPLTHPKPASHLIRPHLSPRPAETGASHPRPAPPAAPLLTAAEPPASAPSLPVTTFAPAAPASPAAAPAGAETSQPSRTPPSPAPPAPAAPSAPAPPAAPVPVDSALSAAGKATDAAAGTVTTAVAGAAAAADKVTSDVRSTVRSAGSSVQSTASSVQSTLSSVVSAGTDLPLPPRRSGG